MPPHEPTEFEAAATDADADRTLLIEAAQAAAPLAMAAFRRGRATSAEVRLKSGDRSPVTEADLAVNAALREQLTAARPDYGWLSEEDPDAPIRRRTQERVFIVDPIDGTQSFVEGKPDFCISVAVVEGGAPLAAAILMPALDRLYHAARGGGAGAAGDAVAPLGVTPRVELAAARVLTPRRDRVEAKWKGGLPEAEFGHLHPIAHRLCLIAAGAWDALASLKQTHEWDVAAGDLIIQEAGGRVSDRAGRPLRYNKPEPVIAGVVAGGAPLHDALLERLR